MSDEKAQALYLGVELNRILDGISPVEKALLLAAAFSEVYNEDWAIDARADGGFSLTPRLPKKTKSL